METINNQKELFLKIWNERDHVCELCDKYLGEIPNAWFFSHILSKGAYPAYKLNPENIMLNCMDCHTEWDAGDPTKCKHHQKFFDKKEQLIQSYYKK